MLEVTVSDHCAFSFTCWWGVNLLYRHMNAEIIKVVLVSQPGRAWITLGITAVHLESMATFFPAGWTYPYYYCDLCNQTSFSVDMQYICVQFVTVAGFPGKWLWHQVCQSSKSIYTMISIIWLIARLSCEEQGVGLGDSYGSFPAWDILWF